MFPRGTTAVLLWLTALVIASALAPLPALRLAPAPAEVMAFLRAPPPASAPTTLPLVGAARAEAPVSAAPLPDLPGPSAPEDPRTARDLARAFAAGARVVAIEDPCLTSVGPTCRTRALDAFHRALRRSGEGLGLTHVVHFGDSTISSDLIAGTVRERLQARFGDGGRGFLFVDGPTRWKGQLARAGRASPGWQIRSLAGPEEDDGRYGFSGASFEALAAGEKVDFATRGSDVFELQYLAQPGGQTLSIEADGREVMRVPTAAAGKQVEFVREKLPPKTRGVTVRARGQVRLFGAVLERDAAGVVYDTLGIPGSSARQLLTMNEADLTAALRRREPDLVIVSLGMNESHRMTGKDLPLFEERQRMLLARLRRAAPGASCLVTSPMDGGHRETGGRIVSEPILPLLRDAQRRAALEAGCGFWDMLEAMGGPGSVARWLEADLAFPDLAHPSNEGGPVLGLLLSDGLLTSHRDYLARAPAIAEGPDPGRPPGLENAGALAGFHDLLRRVAAGEDGARVLQIGDSHTAADRVSSQMRRRFAGGYPSGGRGLVFPGAPWRTAEPEDVLRSGSEGWSVENGLESGGAIPGPFGLSATSADPAAFLRVSSCTGCPFEEVASFEVLYLRQPDGGQLLLSVDGGTPRPVDTSEPGPALGEVHLWVPPGRHQLELRPAGERPVSVVGVALGSARRGIVWEAAGVSGAYAWTPLAWDTELVHDGITERRPDLLVIAYGTNEARDGIDGRYPQTFRALVRLLRNSAREASCLILAPPDQGGGSEVAARLSAILEAQRRVALEEGCAFWDARAAMGGPGSMETWFAAGMAHEDRVHLKATGYRRLADLLFTDLTGTP